MAEPWRFDEDAMKIQALLYPEPVDFTKR